MNTSTDIPRPADFPHILVVRASAGAGKTYSLALRYLQLLSLARRPSPEALRSVMALTFTVAAAQEMKSRIVSFLKEIALQSPQGKVLEEQTGLDPDAAGAWLDCILAHFQSFQVKTIDSLHFQMVQALGRRMALWPDLETSFDQARWARLMLSSFLARTDWGQTAPLPGDAGPDELSSLWEDIFSTYLHLEAGTGVRFLNWLETQAVHVFTGLDQLLRPLQTTSIANLNHRRDVFVQRCQEFCRELERCGLEHSVSRFKPLEDLADPLDKVASAFFARQTPAQLFHKAAHNSPEAQLLWPRYLEMCRARNEYLLGRARLRVDPLARLQGLLVREAHRLSRSQGLILGGWWTRLIRQHLDQGDLLQEAELILGARWRHVLIDEFQDTSREQWDVLRELVLEALAQGGSLFCVGDVKQAIYGWRGGDWRLFSEPLSADVFPNVEDHARLEAVLPGNRRSCPEIVGFNNSCFGRLEHDGACADLAMAMVPGKDKDQARRPLAQAISRLYASAAQAPFVQGRGAVRITSLRAQTSQEYRAMALQALAADIQTLRAGTSLGDVAVLARTNDDAGECAKALLEQGIPTITEQSLSLAAHPRVRGLLALLAWLDNPEDDAALDALCRSPLLDKAGLAPVPVLLAPPLAHAGPDKGTRLYQALRRKDPEAWAAHFQPFWEYAGFSSAYEVLLAAVAHFQLRDLPLGEWAWVEKLLEAAWNAENLGTVGIGAFLDFWREKGRECVVGLPEGLEAVRVLTVHKAKGLEFPCVFLPLLDYGRKNRNDYHVFRTDAGDFYLASATRPRSTQVAEKSDQELAKTMAEELNLLYVAMTRARRELRIYLADVKNARGSRASQWLGALLPGDLKPQEDGER